MMKFSLLLITFAIFAHQTSAVFDVSDSDIAIITQTSHYDQDTVKNSLQNLENAGQQLEIGIQNVIEKWGQYKQYGKALQNAWENFSSKVRTTLGMDFGLDVTSDLFSKSWAIVLCDINTEKKVKAYINSSRDLLNHYRDSVKQLVDEAKSCQNDFSTDCQNNVGDIFWSVEFGADNLSRQDAAGAGLILLDLQLRECQAHYTATNTDQLRDIENIVAQQGRYHP